jgi:hypothetical protein
MTTNLTMVDTAEGEVLEQAIFDATYDSHDMHGALIKTYMVHYMEATDASFPEACEYVTDLLEAKKIEFIKVW